MHHRGPLVITSNNQVVENVCITSIAGHAITGNGFSGVTIRNCVIHHLGGNGIDASNCPGLEIENTSIFYDGAPMAGANPEQANGIHLLTCNGAHLDNIRVQDSSCGIYVQASDSVTIGYLEGHNMRGPSPRGQLVQFNGCTNSTLNDWSVQNDVNVAWTEDDISIVSSTNITIQRGIADGNNSPSGGGVSFAQGSTGRVLGVDAINWANGAFGSVGCAGVSFTSCRSKLRYAPCAQNRGAPSSGGLQFASFGGSSGTIFAACQYVDSGNVVWDGTTCAQTDITQVSGFSQRPYITAQVPQC